MTKDELIQSISGRIEECVRNAYNLGEKNAEDFNQREYKRGYNEGRQSVKGPTDAEMISVQQNAIQSTWLIALTLANTPKETQEFVFGMKGKLSLIMQVYSPSSVIQMINQYQKEKENESK